LGSNVTYTFSSPYILDSESGKLVVYSKWWDFERLVNCNPGELKLKREEEGGREVEECQSLHIIHFAGGRMMLGCLVGALYLFRGWCLPTNTTGESPERPLPYFLSE